MQTSTEPQTELYSADMALKLRKAPLQAALSAVAGVLESSQTLQILSHIRFFASQNTLTLTATDSEVELSAQVTLEASIDQAFDTTIPGKKLLEICRSLPDDAPLEMKLEGSWIEIHSLHSQFRLATLPSTEFPNVEFLEQDINRLTIQEDVLLTLLKRTRFAMAQQDVRYFLNGVLLHVHEGELKTVATNGHRLAYNHHTIETNVADLQAIIPRKAVSELTRLLEDQPETLTLTISQHHIRIESPRFQLTSNLLEGRYPNYAQVIPKQTEQIATINREQFKQALTRTMILSTDRVRGGRLKFTPNSLQISAHNMQHEAADDELTIAYAHDEVEIGFNLTYLLDVLNVCDTDQVKLTLSGADAMVLLEEINSKHGGAFVVMPLSL